VVEEAVKKLVEGGGEEAARLPYLLPRVCCRRELALCHGWEEEAREPGRGVLGR